MNRLQPPFPLPGGYSLPQSPFLFRRFPLRNHPRGALGPTRHCE